MSAELIDEKDTPEYAPFSESKLWKGVVDWIGTGGGTHAFENPAIVGWVSTISSQMSEGNADMICGKTADECRVTADCEIPGLVISFQ